MAKIFLQRFPVIWQSSSAMSPSSASYAGSLMCNGYAQIIGMFYSDTPGSSLGISQSMDGGLHWDTEELWTISASAGSSIGASVVGNAVKVRFRNGASAASGWRVNFMLRPI